MCAYVRWEGMEAGGGEGGGGGRVRKLGFQKNVQRAVGRCQCVQITRKNLLDSDCWGDWQAATAKIERTV